MRAIPFIILLLIPLFPVTVFAQLNGFANLPQNPTYVYTDWTTTSTFSVASVDDLNGDGIRELLLGKRGSAQPPEMGTVKLLDLSTGTVLHTFTGSFADGLFGNDLASLGDINGNGIPDFAVAENNANNGLGKVYLYETSGTLLSTLLPPIGIRSFGIQLANAGDVTGDGKNDLLISAYLSSQTGPDVPSVYLYNSISGSLISAHSGALYSSSLGDITGDLIPDYAAGYPGTSTTPAGWVYLFSGGTHQLITTLWGNDAGSYFGSCVESNGDLDGDSINDIIVCAPGTGLSAGSFPSKVYLYSGATLSLSGTLNGGLTFDQFGFSSASADTNKDGISEVIVSSPGYMSSSSTYGKIDLFSSEDLTSKYSWINTFAPSNALGQSILGDDINGDGFDDILATHFRGFKIYSYGGAWAYGSGPVGFKWVPAQTTGALPFAAGSLVVNGAANTQGYVACSPQYVINTGTVPGITIYVDTYSPNLQIAPIQLDSNGLWTVSLSLFNTNLAGNDIYCQAFLQIPGTSNYQHSNGIHLVLVD